MKKLIRNVDGLVVATIKDETLFKTVKGSVHKLRVPEAWCWDEKIIEDAKAEGVNTILIYDSETKKRYSVSMTDFVRLGLKIDRGYGPQVALPIRHWAVRGMK